MTTIDIPYGPTAPPISAAGEAVQRQADQAATRLAAERAKLLRPDGSPIWGPEEHKERAAALLATFDQAMQPLYESAEADEAAARVSIAALEGSDPIDTLKGDDLARAGNLRTFIAEEAAELPLRQLLPRLRAALGGTDRPALVLWARYAGKRWDALIDAVGRHDTRAAGSDTERSELRAILDQLQAAVADQGADRKREQAISAIVTARAVQGHIRRTRATVGGPEGVRASGRYDRL